MGFFTVSSMGSRRSWKNRKEAVLLVKTVILSSDGFVFTQKLNEPKFSSGFSTWVHFLANVAFWVQRGGQGELRQLCFETQCNADNTVHVLQPPDSLLVAPGGRISSYPWIASGDVLHIILQLLQIM